MRTNQSQSVDEAARLQPCGLLRLFMVIIYDAIVVLAILIIAGTVALELPFRHQSAGKDPAYTLYLLLAWFFYLAWCWRHGGMTLGMRAWKVQLLNLRNGTVAQPPAWWQCGLRFLGAWLSALPAGAGYLWMLVDRDKRSWHDRLSQTRLVHHKSRAKQSASGRPPEEIDRAQAK